MNRNIILSFVGSLALIGCVNTYDIARTPPEVPRDQVDANLLGKVWTIERLDGQTTKGTVTAASPDAITYVDEYSGQANTVPTRNLATISTSPGALGPVVGLLGGALVGAFIGGAIGVAQPVSNSVEGVLIEPVANTASGGLIGAFIGAPVGLIIGSEVSAGKEYVFNRRGSGGNTNLDTTILIDRKDLIRQDDTSITILWEGKEKTLSRNVALIYPQGERLRIVLPRSYIRQ